MKTSYQVPKQTVRIEYQVSNSRFYATIGRADSVEEAKSFIQSIRQEMPDATHHVYAYVIGHGSSVIEGMSDDGEPSGTAGPPTLAVLRGSGLGNIVLVTTRYFGGTKLGTGGLVHAYGQAAKEALLALPVETLIVRTLAGVDIPYSLYERVKLLLHEFDAEIDEEIFAADVTIVFRIPSDNTESFSERLRDLSSGQVHITILEENV
ncbi:MAG: YigZ family protein [Phototrophicales bacterium]|nr:MAG: YigZ family protein [Phototrophicales bacterium]